MRILRILFLIFLTTLAGIIIESCCDGYEYRFTYVLTRNLEFSQRTGSLIEANDSASRDDYGIRIYFFNQKIASAGTDYFSGNNLLAAYDCWPIFTMEDSITDIRIHTLNKMNAAKNPGDDVTEAFKAIYYNHEDRIPIKDKIGFMNEDDMNISDFMDVLLTDNEILPGQQQFIVTVVLSDDRMMIDTTNAIKIY